MKRVKIILRIEGWGLILIFISFFWQIIETDLQNMAQESEYYKIHMKLDALWQLQSYEYVNSPLNESKIENRINFEHLFNNWKYYGEDRKTYDYLNNQLDWAVITRLIFFIFGSILLIIPKFMNPTPD